MTQVSRLCLAFASLALTTALSVPVFAQTIVVDESHPDWAFVPETGSPDYAFATGPGTPPQGVGSATFTLNATADGAMLWTALHAGTRLGDITALSYSTYQNTSPQAVALQFNVDYDDTDSFTDWQGRLVYEPYHSQVVSSGTWQNWDTLDITGWGSWWSTGTPVVGDSAAAPICPQSSPCTWDEVVATYPNAAIHQGSLAGILLKAGSGWPVPFVGAADALHFATASVDVLYDFEHVDGAPINTSRLSMNGWYSDDTRADGTAAAPEAEGTNLISPTLTDDPEAGAAGDPAHDDDITNQILFPLLGPPLSPPPGTWTGSVYLRIANGVNPAKSQISHRKDDGIGFASGDTVLMPGFWVEYHWLGTGTGSITASFKLGFKTTDFGSTGSSSRTGENSWDKLLVYEPGGGNGQTSDGTWHTETIDLFSGNWWLVDRTNGGNTMGNPMTLAEMAAETTVTVGGRTVAEIFQLMAAPEAQLTSMQLGIGSYNAGGQVYVNQVQTSFYRPGQTTIFGRDPGLPVVRCVPSEFDPACEVAHPSIQAAVDEASDDDIVLVDSGTYTETVTLDKRLTLRGAAAEVSACERSSDESIVSAADPGDAVLTLAAGADGSSIDGFSFQGGLHGITTDSGPLDGVEILNNRFASITSSAILLAHGGSDISVSGNDFDASTCTASASIALDAALPGLYVNNNCIHDGIGCTAVHVLGNASVAASASRSPAFAGNLVNNNLAGFNLGAGQVSAADISSNQVVNHLDYGLAGGPTDSLIFDNLIADNGGAGLALTSFSDSDPASAARNNLVAVNCFYRNGSHALDFAADQAPESIATNEALYNDFRENASGASYSGAETVFAELNWWGAENGPSGDGPGSGDSVTGAGLVVIPFVPQPNTWDSPCHQLTDLRISMEDDVATYVWPGDRVLFTIEVNNDGPWDVVDAPVENTIPSGLAACAWSCSAGAGGSCGSGSGSGDLVDLVDLQVGATATYTLDCVFSPYPTWASTLNSSTVSPPVGSSDSDGANNLATETTRSFIIFEDGFETGDTTVWSHTVN